MQYLVLSDIHANWHALETVLADCKGEYDEVVCCGDIVGYNANPSKAVEWIRANCSLTVRGNHDKVICGIDDLEWFNDIAKQAAIWTREVLTGEQLDFLRQLKPGPVSSPHFHMWHGSPVDEDEYVSDPHDAAPRFAGFELPLAFFGHTHLQGGFLSRYGRIERIPQVARKQREAIIYIKPDTLYMVNPGSVGQPRDRDLRAAYALYDSESRTVRLRRVHYPVGCAAEAIRDANLPEVLALRLFGGF